MTASAEKPSHMKSDWLVGKLVAVQSVSNGNKVLNLVDPLDVNTAKAGPPSCLSNPPRGSVRNTSQACAGAPVVRKLPYTLRVHAKPMVGSYFLW